jgi:hypothetical protein
MDALDSSVSRFQSECQVGVPIRRTLESEGDFDDATVAGPHSAHTESRRPHIEPEKPSPGG